MGTILLLELKKVFFNRRFLIFTIIIPSVFFIILSKMDNGTENITSLLLLCILYGMIGNNVVTMSTRISREKPFYINVYKTTDFTMLKSGEVQFMVQFILNVVIVAVLSIVGLITSNIDLSLVFLYTVILVFVYCSFFSLIGFSLGNFFDSLVLQTISNPLYMLLIVISLPDSIANFFPKFFIKIQRHLPGHFLWNSVSTIYQNQWSFNGEVITLFVYMIVLTLIIVGLILWNQHRGVERD